MNARSSAVASRSVGAEAPTGMYVKNQANFAPRAIRSSMNASLPMEAAFACV